MKGKKWIIRSFAFGWLSVSAFIAASSASHFATQKYYFSNGQEVSFQNLLFSIGIEKYEISEYDYPKNLSENELLEAFEKLQSFTRNIASAFKNYGPTTLSFYSKSNGTVEEQINSAETIEDIVVRNISDIKRVLEKIEEMYDTVDKTTQAVRSASNLKWWLSLVLGAVWVAISFFSPKDRIKIILKTVSRTLRWLGITVSLSVFVALDQLEEAGKDYIVNWIVAQVYGSHISSLTPYLPSLESLTVKFRNFKSRLTFIDSQSNKTSFLQEVKEIWNKAKRCFIHFEELTDK